MSIESDRLAQSFMNKETQFHLGFLPTEQSSPLTKNLDREFAKSSVDGVKNLQSVDRNVLTMFRQIFESDRFRKLVDDGLATLRHGGRIVFSGCGATGRLSILLESMWRNGCIEVGLPELCKESCGLKICQPGIQHHDWRRFCFGQIRGVL